VKVPPPSATKAGLIPLEFKVSLEKKAVGTVPAGSAGGREGVVAPPNH